MTLLLPVQQITLRTTLRLVVSSDRAAKIGTKRLFHPLGLGGRNKKGSLTDCLNMAHSTSEGHVGCIIWPRIASSRKNPGMPSQYFMCPEVAISQRIHPGADPASTLRGTISVIFGSQASLRLHYGKRHEVYFTTLLWQNNRWLNGLISWMLFSELYKIFVKKVTFVGFRGGDRPNRPPPWIRHCWSALADKINAIISDKVNYRGTQS